MTATVVILAPTDIKPGSVAPDGRVVKEVKFYPNAAKQTLLAGVTYEDETVGALIWPLGFGWTVDGRTAPFPEGGDGA